MSVAEKTKTGVIDMTPSWLEILPTYLMIYRDASPTGYKAAMEELRRMATLADLYVAAQKAGKV